MNEKSDSRAILSSLGDPSRFKVVIELLRGERCVSDLAERVGLSQSCTTRHLQALERVGIVRSQRAGKKVMASISREPRVAALLSWALAAEESEPRATVTSRVSAPAPVTRPAEPTGAGHEATMDVDSAAETDPSEVGQGPARPREDMEDFLL